MARSIRLAVVASVPFVAFLAFIFPALDPFHLYSTSAAYHALLASHAHRPPPARWRHEDAPYLHLSWMPTGSPRSAYHRYVSRGGRIYSTVYYWQYAVHGGGALEPSLSPAQENVLKATLHRLPATSPESHPWRYRDLLIVSYDDAGHWNTRFYDRAHLPTDVRFVLDRTMPLYASRKNEP